MIKQKVKKKINWKITLEKYRQRLLSEFDSSDFAVFHNHFISTYRIYSTITEDINDEHGLFCDAFVVYLLAKSYGYNPFGICSERIVGGVSVSTEQPRIYIGKYCYSSRLKSSKFRIKPCDKVFYYEIEQ